jgi:ferredoxin
MFYGRVTAYNTGTVHDWKSIHEPSFSVCICYYLTFYAKGNIILPSIIPLSSTLHMKHCKECNTCVESCPVQAIDIRTKRIDYTECIECMCRHELCRYQAVRLKRINPLASLMMSMYRGDHR